MSSQDIMIPALFDVLPSEVHVAILTCLRAYELSALQQTCRFFASRQLIRSVIRHTAEHVYPPEWTQGFTFVHYTFSELRDLEWSVVARVLSRPEPRSGFYVSKSWCRTTLKWLQLQQQQGNNNNTKKKKRSKKQQRIRNRRLSDASPPWPNVNADLVCCHGDLQHGARRRVLDKQAWKVLKKLYPNSCSLESVHGECIQCALQLEQAKAQQERQRQQRKMPLSDPLVRAIYTRTRGVPTTRLSDTYPLQPGLYHVLPRAWLHGWRRHLKTGEGDTPCAPDASALLCDGHRLPLLPPHLEAFLRGETTQLLSSSMLPDGIVVEILTDEEFTALEKWWPNHIGFCLRFTMMDNNVEWSTPPCRDCSDKCHHTYIPSKNRNRTKKQQS